MERGTVLRNGVQGGSDRIQVAPLDRIAAPQEGKCRQDATARLRNRAFLDEEVMPAT
jgi:hypothetical protein